VYIVLVVVVDGDAGDVLVVVGEAEQDDFDHVLQREGPEFG